MIHPLSRVTASLVVGCPAAGQVQGRLAASEEEQKANPYFTMPNTLHLPSCSSSGVEIPSALFHVKVVTEYGSFQGGRVPVEESQLEKGETGVNSTRSG